MQKISLPRRWFPPNAISRAELVYLGRQFKERRWFRFLLPALEWGMLTVSMILFWGEFAGSLLQRDAGSISKGLGVIPLIFVIYTFFRHFGLMLHTLTLSANGIVREKQAATWEMLILTGIDARQIVRGKWLAVVQYQFPAYVMLGLLRVGAVVYLSADLSRTNANSFFVGNLNPWVLIPPPALQVLLAGIIVFLFTLVNLFFTAACGILASTESKYQVTALVRAILNRPLAIVVFFFVAGILVSIIPISLDSTGRPSGLNQIISVAFLSLVDNGAQAQGSLVATYIDGYAPRNFIGGEQNSELHIVLGSLLTLIFYVLLTLWMLRWAQRRAARLGASQPLYEPKSKRKIGG